MNKFIKKLLLTAITTAIAVVGFAGVSKAATLKVNSTLTDNAVVFTIDATGEKLHSLEIDHSLQGTLPEFHVYAVSGDDAYGDDSDKDQFDKAGVTVTYSDSRWVINFGSEKKSELDNNSVSDLIKNETFYFVLKGENGPLVGTMYKIGCNTMSLNNGIGSLDTNSDDCNASVNKVTSATISGNDKSGYTLTVEAVNLLAGDVDGVVFDVSPAIAGQNSLSLCHTGSADPYVKGAYCLGDSEPFLTNGGKEAKDLLDSLDITLGVSGNLDKTIWTINLGSKFIEANRNKTFTVSNIRLFKGIDPDTNIVSGSEFDGTLSQTIPKKKTSSGGSSGSRPVTQNTNTGNTSTSETPSNNNQNNSGTASTPVERTQELQKFGEATIPGARGESVAELQKFLNENGFGPLIVDGISGPQTLAAVERYINSSNNSASGITPSTILKVNNRGAGVSTLQALLNAKGFNVGPADGIFGPRTLAQVRAFQSANGLVVDGIVGPATLRALGL